MSKNIVFEGWLTKSPPTKRIWRTKWRRRWFALRQSGELPGQYFLDYYADRNCRRLKGTINLDLCEQVDAGLHMERSGTGTLDPKLRGSVFTIQTQSRTYHLEADCEAEMEKWVDAICRVCGLRATEDSANVLVTYQNSSTMTASNEHYERVDSTGPYIPISECITGVRARDDQRPYPFDQRSGDNKNHQYLSHPHIRITNAEFSENESNISDEDCKSLNASQSNIRGDWAVAKTFTKLAINKKRNGVAEDGPPVPPRPPKTFSMNIQKESFQGPKELESVEVHVENISPQGHPWLRLPRRASHAAGGGGGAGGGAGAGAGGGAGASPRRSRRAPSTVRFTDDEDDYSPGQVSMQYCNLPSLPPAVDRASKPRHSSHSIGHISHLSGQTSFHMYRSDDLKPDVLQYLDLDLHTSPAKSYEVSRKNMDIVHGKSYSAVDADSAYKTVDFLKTEAFNITRQDAEASRSSHH